MIIVDFGGIQRTKQEHIMFAGHVPIDTCLPLTGSHLYSPVILSPIYSIYTFLCRLTAQNLL